MNDIYGTVLEIIAKYYNKQDGYNADEGFNPRKPVLMDIYKEKFNQANIADWQEFVDRLRYVFGDKIEVHSDTTKMDSCYSVLVSITNVKYNNLRHTQKFFCHMSFLGNYYCVYGRDEVVKEDDKSKRYFGPIITISPKGIYERFFELVERELIAKYPGCVFLPYSLLSKRINGLKINVTCLKQGQFSSIFQALFKPENLTDFSVDGISRYH